MKDCTKTNANCTEKENDFKYNYLVMSMTDGQINLDKEKGITLEDALENATNPDDLMLKIKGIDRKSHCGN